MNRNAVTNGCGSSNVVDSIYKKIAWRTVPLLMLCYIVAYLDRVNIGFAKLQMSGDLNLDDAAFALGASIFFWGYMLFEFPSNLLLQRLGARFWIARIMVSWGIVSAMIAFTGPIASFLGIQNATVFYTLRLLLGICEAGFFPGVVLYVNQWFPVHRQGRIFAGFLLALPTSLIIGSPLSGALLHVSHGWMGLQGWQWMIVIEAVPALILGVVVWMRLSSTPETASFLTNREREIVLSDLAVKDDKKPKHIS